MIFLLLGFQYGRSATAMYTPQASPVKLIDCINISVGEIERISGKKLNLFQRISFGLLKHKMKKALRKDRDMTLDQFMRSKKKSSGPGGAGLIIFAIVGLIAIIILIVFHRSYDP